MTAQKQWSVQDGKEFEGRLNVKSLATWQIAGALLSFITLLIAYCSEGWLKNTEIDGVETRTVGLWRSCDCTSIGFSWYGGVQAMITLGFMCALATLGSLCVQLTCWTHRYLVYATIAACFAGVLFVLLGVIIMGAKYDVDQLKSQGYRLAWAYAFTVISMFLSAAVGGLTVFIFIKSRNDED